MTRHLVLSLLCIVASVSCQSVIRENSADVQSLEHLKVALLAIDRGDLGQAEAELKLSLQFNPLNSRASTVLSSVYARQAGITLRTWLDPFWEASRQLDARVKYFVRSTTVLKELNRLIGNISGEEKVVQERIKTMMDLGAQATLGLSVMLDVFKTIPYLDDAQLMKLDEAIHVLRIEGVAAQNWQEEQRVYLAILSVVRLINHAKRTVGDSITETDTLIDQLCRQDSGFLKHEMAEIKRSLFYLEEGLVVNPFDPMTSQREGRKRFQEFISKSLSGAAWAQLENLFDQTTPDGIAAQQISEMLCKPITNDSL